MQNDTISNNGSWVDTAAYLIRGGWDCCTNGLGYQCSSNVLSTTYSFIGTRMYLPTDTVYGWIRVKDAQVTNSVSIVIDSYASRDRFTRIDEKIETNVAAYPNPVSSELNFRFSSSQTNRQLTVYNLLSEVVHTEVIPAGIGAISVQATSLPCGLYTYSIDFQSSKKAVGKFIISR